MASFTSAQSLLAIPEDLTKPDAYQVFGLPAGESDPARIAAAIKATIIRLNRVKEAADPAAWRQAAAWVKAARTELAESARRPPAATETAVNGAAAAVAPAEPVFDPLAGVLPGTTAPQPPAAAAPTFHAGSARLTAGADQLPPPPPPPPQVAATPAGQRPEVRPAAAAPVVAASAALGPDDAAPSIAAPVVVAPRPTGRKRRGSRRGSPWASIAVVAFAIGCIGIVVVLIYVLNQNEGKLVVSLQPGGATNQDTPRPPTAAAPSGTSGRSDPVMGRLGGEQSGGRSGRTGPGGDRPGGSGSRRPATGSDMTAGPSQPQANGAMTPSRDASSAMETPSDPKPNGEGMPGGGTTTGPTEEQLAAGETALMQAKEVIRAADWSRMVEATEQALAAAVSSEQRTAAQRLNALADLATHYREGVDRGLEKLSAGESFDLTEQLQVVVVEINAEQVIVRFSGRNKEYPRESLPLVIVHKVARFALPVDSPVTAAAAMAFQAIAPVSTIEYRQQAIRQLAAIEEPDDRFDPTELIAAIEDVYAP